MAYPILRKLLDHMQYNNGESGISMDCDVVVPLMKEIQQLLPPAECGYCWDIGRNWPAPYNDTWTCPHCNQEYKD